MPDSFGRGSSCRQPQPSVRDCRRGSPHLVTPERRAAIQRCPIGAARRPHDLRLLAVAVRLMGIGAILAGIGAAFAYAAGWFSPERLRPDDVADSLEAHDGVHPGLRQRTALSRAGVFAPGEMPPIAWRRRACP
jgi:hypothetical protein